jgi:Uma2 family endonuclease
VLFAPYRLRVPARRYREPDILFLTPEQDARTKEEFTDSAEVVMEVVSADDPERDYIKKRRDYAEAGVAEYWIVDHAQRAITVLCLSGGQYVEHGKYGPGQKAESARLAGFSVQVDELLSLGR